MEYVSMVSELNYMSQIVIMLYEDPTKDPCSEERFHIELHFSPGVNCCVQKNLPPGPGFRPHSRNESSGSKNSVSQEILRHELETKSLICFQSINTSTTATPEDKNHLVIDEVGEIAIIEEEKIAETPKLFDSISSADFTPPLSPELVPSKTYTQKGYLKTSAPIPIG